ncbi:MAG: hypothetical protein JSW61_04495 [Candidatus Thorarchaeota archaeon]|nr:MAG: hypothetical protein JSW61_04495 [Candidatus Thorarchaeota archaeon]
MYFEIGVAFWSVVVFLFLVFWIVQEGSRWQKNRLLGVFARFIQHSAGRAFVLFFLLTILIIPASLSVMSGLWYDAWLAGGGNAGFTNTVPVVTTFLLMFLLLSGMIPVMWSSFRTWRQAVRSAREVRVQTTAEM